MVYLPPVFTESRSEVLIAHIERHDFGLLVSQGEAAPTASHVPFLVERRDGRLLLQAHLARPNPQLAELDRAGEALAIFQGPHAYVSPTWYTAGPAVPTWNYAAVHAYGRVRTIADADWLREFVRRLSERHEAHEPAPPWRMEELPAPYITSMLRGIVGVEIEVSRLEGKFKLSQNRPAADRPRIIAALEARKDAESRDLAVLMRRREPPTGDNEPLIGRAVQLALLLLVATLWWAPLASAAEHAPAPAASAAAPPETPTALPADEVQALIEALQDDKARARLVRQLQAFAAAERQTEAAAPVEPADFLTEMVRRLHAVGGELLAGAAVVLDAPLLIDWASGQITNAQTRGRWGEVLLACAVVFGLGIAVEWALRRLFARFGQEPAAPDEEVGRAMRGMHTALGLLLELLPVCAFSAAALLALGIMLPPFTMARSGLAELVWATITARLIMAAAKAVLVPRPAWPSLVPAEEETRNYLLIWVRRFTCWGMFGYGITAAAWWLGVPGAIYALMLKIVGLGLTMLGIVFVLQNRQAIGAWITGEERQAGSGWVRLRRHLGETWHVLAIVYIGTVYLAYSLHNEAGSHFVLRATALTLLAVVAARLLVRLMERTSRRGLAVAPDLAARFPMLEQRANRYLPVAIRFAAVAIYVLAALAVLQAWHIASFSWFATGLGRRVGGTVLSIVLVLALALVAWEMLAAAIERNLAALDHEGAPSRTRRRTLLPLLRTVIACVIVAIAALIVLSQIGIDIAPLLAGAGVIGVAIGFGSQALIKDIITGLFILVEDQIAVGDIVDVGKEHAGVVEAITIRTIRLRDQGGVVHTVPFSEVTSVKNLTKDFAYAVARVGIAYGENVDRVVDILRGVCDELAEDEEIGPLILDRFDYQGVDSLNEYSVVLLLRVKTLPGKQWVVGRALNRRIRDAFEQHGIAGRNPSPIIVTGPTAAILAAATEPAQTADRGDPPAEEPIGAPQRRSA